MIAAKRVIYNGHSNIDFDLLCDVAFDTDNGATDTFLNREAIMSESYSGTFRRVHSYKHTDVFAPTITFIKNNFEEFTELENRKIISWLTSKHTASWLTVYRDDSEVISYELLGGFTNIEQYKLTNGSIVGYICTFESVSPYAYSPLKVSTHTINTPTTITLQCNTDDYESLVYPKITVCEKDSVVVNIDSELARDIFKNDNYISGTVYHCDGTYYWRSGEEHRATSWSSSTTYYTRAYNSSTSTYVYTQVSIPDSDTFEKYDGLTDEKTLYTLPVTSYTNASNTSGITTTSVSITNETLGVKTYIKGNTRNEDIIIDGANKLITTQNPLRVIGDDYSWNWLPLVAGENQIKIIGNCTVTLEWREPIKCGHI